MNNIKILQEQYKTLLKQGKEKDILPIIEKCIKLSVNENNIVKLIELLNDYGGALRNTGNYKKSISTLLLAKELIEKENLKNTEAYANTLANLGNAYRLKEDYKKSIEYFSLANIIFEQIHSYGYSYAANLNNLSLLFITLKFWDKAYDLLKKAETILLGLPEYKIQLATTYNNLYEVALNLEKFDESKYCLFKAEEILSLNINANNPLYASVLNNLGDYYFRKKDYQNSLKLYKLSKNFITNTYGIDSEAYKIVLKNIKKIESFIEDSSKRISGLDRSENFFNNYVSDYVLKHHKDLWNISCFGLVGEGSECYGYDDYISEDHNFETKCYWFLPKSAYNVIKNKKIEINSNLLIIKSIENFYKYYTLFEEGPVTISEYRKVPQDLLSLATNGKIFLDNLGYFTKIRNRLLNYYPQDLVYKKIAYCCNKAAQAGQYNYERCLKRNNYFGAQISLSEFLENYCELIHLINKKFMPFYKWQYRSLENLKLLGYESKCKIDDLLSLNDKTDSIKKIKIIEELCVLFANYLRENKISKTADNFLLRHSSEIVENIHDNNLKNENTWIK